MMVPPGGEVESSMRLGLPSRQKRYYSKAVILLEIRIYCSYIPPSSEFLDFTWHHWRLARLIVVARYLFSKLSSIGQLLDYNLVTSPASVFLSRVPPLTQPEYPYYPTFEVAIDLGTVMKEKSDKSTKRIAYISLLSQRKRSEAK